MPDVPPERPGPAEAGAPLGRVAPLRLTRRGLVTGAAVGLLGATAWAGVLQTRSEPVALGVTADGLDGYDAFAHLVAAPVGLYQWYQAWEGSPAFDAARAQAAVVRGAVPLLTWEPWAPGGGVEQPRYALPRLVAGDHDGYLASFARQVRAWGGPLALRVAHELNAPFYPWSVGVNGNTAADAVAAWHHVRDVFAGEGADVVWVWSVNVSGAETVPYDLLYPGDDAVDWIGLDGYNGGGALPWGGWKSPEQLLGEDLASLRQLSDRPLVLTEVASAEPGGDKGAWVDELFALCRRAGVRAAVWFDYAKEADWRATSSPGAAAAFARLRAAGIAPLPPLPRQIALPTG